LSTLSETKRNREKERRTERYKISVERAYGKGKRKKIQKDTK
jgi:hypothetical protein